MGRHPFSALTVAIAMVSLVLAAAPGDARTARVPVWQLVFQEEFSDASYKDDWQLDGKAELTLKTEGKAGYLEIATKKRSVLWLKRHFGGDIRVVFRARGQTKNRSIFYFNARPTPDSGFKTVFDWPRPDADMKRYAGTNIVELYTVGMLRDDQDVCNLRYLGGTTAWAYNRPKRNRDGAYDTETIFKPYDSPFRNQPDTWFEFDVQVIGEQILMVVNHVTVIDLVDPGRTPQGKSTWKPLVSGGWIGFRNFRPKTVCLDYVRVYRRVTTP